MTEIPAAPAAAKPNALAEKPALSDMERFKIAEEVEAKKAKIRDLLRVHAPDKKLPRLRFLAANVRTQCDAVPDEWGHGDDVHLAALEALVAEMEREAKT